MTRKCDKETTDQPHGEEETQSSKSYTTGSTQLK